MTSFGVRPYRADDRSEVLGLLAQVWGTSTEGRAIVQRHETQWDWRFTRNPYADSDLPTGLVLESDDAIVGFISCMPARVNLHGGVVGAFWSGEWVTAPQRGRGFGHLLQRRLMTLPALGLATPNPIAYPALKRLGWSDVYHLENRIRVVRADRILAATNRPRVPGRAAGWVLRTAASLAAPSRRRAGADARLAIVPTRRFDERFDAFWRRVAPGYPVAVVRDSRFLEWRYVEIPDREYAIAAAERGGEIAGYVVFYVRQRRGLVFGHVIDLLVAKGDSGARDALLAHAVEELERRGVDLVNCYLSPYDAFLRAGLRRCGFFFARQSGVVVVRDGARPADAAAVEPHEWFLSRGDSDLDMAT